MIHIMLILKHNHSQDVMPPIGGALAWPEEMGAANGVAKEESPR